jgi:hypothetical protein
VRATLLFAGALLVTIAILGALLTIPFGSALDRRSIEISGLTALVVQLVTFSLARTVRGAAGMTGWLIGAAVRFATLLLYGLLIVRPLGLEPPAALISLATFYFVSTFVELKLLNTLTT